MFSVAFWRVDEQKLQYKKHPMNMYVWFTENVPGNRHGPTQGNEEEKKSQFHIMALINLLFIQITATALF